MALPGFNAKESLNVENQKYIEIYTIRQVNFITPGLSERICGRVCSICEVNGTETSCSQCAQCMYAPPGNNF